MLLKVLRISECSFALVTLVRSLAGVHRSFVIHQQPTSLKAGTAYFALESLIVHMRNPSVRVQVRTLGKTGFTEIAGKRFFTCK